MEKRQEEIHLAELTATARNDEEVIAKLHKVCASPSDCLFVVAVLNHQVKDDTELAVRL